MHTPAVPRVGVFLIGGRFPLPGPGRTKERALAELPRYAAAAEQAGFDDVFVAEHHFMSYGTCPSAITLAAALLGATRRIGVGTAVSVLSTTHPVALAEQAAILATLYPGRFTLGVGRGGPWVDLEVFGTGIEAYERDFPESLELLLAWLGADALGSGPTHAPTRTPTRTPTLSSTSTPAPTPALLAWDGRRHRFRPVDVVPRPERPPGVLLACTSSDSARLAARLGLPILLGMHSGDEAKLELLTTYADAGPGPGFGPGPTAAVVAAAEHYAPSSEPRHAMAAVAHVADTCDEAHATVRGAMRGWLREGLPGYRRFDGTSHKTQDPDTYTEHLCSIHAVGDPEHCVTRLRASMQRTGIRHLLLFVEGAGDPDAVLGNIARLGRDVLPALRA